MDAAVEKEIVRRDFSKARQDRALYALQSSKRHSYIWKLDESFSGAPTARSSLPEVISVRS